MLHRVLTASLNRAVELQLIPRNPAIALRRRLPKAERGDIAILSAEQIGIVLDATKGTDLQVPVLTALATGARRGEICALRWRTIDLDRGAVTIAENAGERRNGKVLFGPTKAHRVRRVSLPGIAV